MSLRNIVHLKRGDTLPPIEAVLSLGEDALNLAGCTVNFRFWLRDGSGPARSRACVLVSADEGKVRVDWQSGDLDTAGAHDAEFEILYPDARRLTVPGGSYVRLVILPNGNP